MRINEKHLDVWIHMKKLDFTVSSAHCTCIAGQGECCTHIAALLFYINFFTCTEEISVTDQPAYWDKPGCSKKLEVCKGSSIDFWRPSLRKNKIKRQFNVTVPVSLLSDPVHNFDGLVVFLQNSKNCIPNAAIRRCVKPFNEEIQRSRSQYRQSMEIDEYNPSVPNEDHHNDIDLKLSFEIWTESVMDDVSVLMLTSSCPSNCAELYEKCIRMNAKRAREIFVITRGQSNVTWKFQRTLRFTGSISYSLYTYSRGKNKENMAKKFQAVMFSSFTGNATTKHGIDCERLCGDVLHEKYGVRFHRNLGLFININYPWFAYSADGLLESDTGEKKMLIEIKSPKLGETLSGTDLCEQLKYLTKTEHGFTIKKKHTYYCQIQLGLFLYGLQLCKLLIFSKHNNSYTEIDITFDPDFCKDIICALSELYFKEYLSFLLERKKASIEDAIELL